MINQTNQNPLSTMAQITRQLNRVENLERHLHEYKELCPKIVNRSYFKCVMRVIKKLELSVCIQHKKLRSLKRDLELQRKNGKTLVISERLEMFFSIARGLKPKLSKKIDSLLVK